MATRPPWILLSFVLAFGPDLPAVTVPVEAVRFNQTQGTETIPTGHSVDISSPNTRIRLLTISPEQTAIGLLAVAPLKNPSLDGVTLMGHMPTESTLVLNPNGYAVFSYHDLYDPYWNHRQPQWRELQLEEGTIQVDSLADNILPAKVATDAVETGNGFFLLDPEGRITFHWSGNLKYCFDFSHPLESFALTDPSGRHRTILTADPGLEISLSDGSGQPITVWHSRGEGKHQPDIVLPAALRQSRTLCVNFTAPEDTYPAIEQLYLHARLRMPAAERLTRFPAKGRTLIYSDAAESSHRALLFWENGNITVPTTSPLQYPEDKPEIREQNELLQVRLPGQVLVEFFRKQQGTVGNLKRLIIGEKTVFKAAPGAPWTDPFTITLLEGTPNPLPVPWSSHVENFLNSGRWTPYWQRRHRQAALHDLAFDGVRTHGNSVILRWRLTLASGPGIVDWRFAPVQTGSAGNPLTGVVMQLKVEGSGLRSAERIAIRLPLAVRPGDWKLEQFFRHLVEERLDFQGPARYPEARWFAESQSFVFHTGPGGTVLGGFAAPTAAMVRQGLEAGRHMYHFDLPLQRGGIRETTPLYWFALPSGSADRWNAVNLWSHFLDNIRHWYASQNGVLDSRPVPTVVWNQPLEENFPDSARSWFDWFTQTQLPRMEAAGIRNVILQAPWFSDAEVIATSFHAPRSLQISSLLGGREALKRLVAEAHRRGIQVTLWYPSAFSLRSPFLNRHADWTVWKISGIPEDGGWGDIVVMDTRTDYFQYAVDAVTALHREIPFDGLWMDSWDLAMATDYSDPQPTPQLDRAIALQRRFTQLGLSQIIIEGLGPLGRPDAYGDYESHSGPPKNHPTVKAELERIRNHEYMLYHIGAATYLDLPVYHRTLASGGLINIANPDEIDALAPGDRAWLRSIHRDHRKVMHLMQHRSLLADGDLWLGTAWTHDGSGDAVIFAFNPFHLQVNGTVTVEDVTTGERFQATGKLRLQPFHTYIIFDALSDK